MIRQLGTGSMGNQGYKYMITHIPVSVLTFGGLVSGCPELAIWASFRGKLYRG